MRILHTSDWHLGKTLEGHSRLPEQEAFLEELIQIADEEDVHLILVAGDIYDHSNPPAAAEKLFYSAAKKLSKDGQRPIIAIAGNHDSPEGLTAASPLAWEHGIILLGTPKSVAPKGRYRNYEIHKAGQGFIELSIGEERLVAITLPYPSEKRLNEIISMEGDEDLLQASYSQRIGALFQELSAHFRVDTINLLISHLYMVGGEESDSERQIQMGGSMAVEASLLPPAQYIALGHLHRPQVVGKMAYYSGSPIQYSKSEIHYSKSVYIIDIEAGGDPLVRPVHLRNYKPIEVWRCPSIQDAIQRCEEEADKTAWVYLEIETSRVLTNEEIRTLRDLRKDIVEIRPILTGEGDTRGEIQNPLDLDIMELFSTFYLHEKGAPPREELVDMFAQIIGQEEDGDEADHIED